MKDGKIIRLNQDVIDTYDNEVMLCYQLTHRQAIILSAMTQFIAWKTRWLNLTYTVQELQDIRERIEYQLLDEGNCGMVITDIRFVDCEMQYLIGEEWIVPTGFDPECFTGIQGEQGIQGIQGEQGTAGADGADGTSFDSCIFATVLGTPAGSIELPIDGEWDELIIRSGLRHSAATGGVTTTQFRIAFNDDTDVNNYRTLAADNQNIIGKVGGSLGSDEPLLSYSDIRIIKPNGDTHKQAFARTTLQNSIEYPLIDSQDAVVWQSTDEITKVTLYVSSGNFEAASYVQVFARKCNYEAPPIEPDWIAEIDFSDGDDPGFVTALDESTLTGGAYRSANDFNEDVQLQIAIGVSTQIVMLETDCFFASANGANITLDITSPSIGEVFAAVYDSSENSGIAIMQADIDATASTFEINVAYTFGTEFSHAEVQKIRLGGIGTIPSSLAPYEI